MILLTQLLNFFVVMAISVSGIVKLFAQVSLKSPAYKCHASTSCLLLFMHMMPCALVLALAKAGKSKLARMAMMAMTTNRSIKVKPLARGVLPAIGFVKFFIIFSTLV